MLEKQVEILTNLVHAQSNIMSKFSCESGANSNPTSECILKIADQAKKISKLEGELKSLQTVSTTQGNSIQQLQATVSGQSIYFNWSELTDRKLCNNKFTRCFHQAKQVSSHNIFMTGQNLAQQN